MPLDPMVLDYLKKRRNPYERDEMEDRPFYKDPQFAAAITQGLAQGVTLHGKSPDASPVQNFANYVTSKEEKRRQRDMMAKEFEDKRDSDILNRMASEKQREDAMSIARLKSDIDKNRYEKEFGLKEQESRNRAEDLRLRREQSSLDRGLKDRYYNILEKKANLENKDKEPGSEIHNKKRAEKLMDQLSKENIEFNSRFYNIEKKSDSLKDLISKSGTYNVFGSEPTEKSGLLYSMALDAVKSADTGSVVSKAEQESAAKSMVDSGNWTSKDTAIKSIDNFMKMARERREGRIRAQKEELDRVLSGNLEPVGYEQKQEIKEDKNNSPKLLNTKEDMNKMEPGDIVIFKGENWVIGKDGGLDPI